MKKEDPTIAELLKPLGYMCGQFGKNHLGDRDEMVPTNHGFDEFFGNLYHLNAEQEPEHPDYPKNPEFKKKFGPRGVIHSFADGKIEDTGPLTIKRMETVDEEVTTAALDFMDRANKAGKPFFVWWNSTRMHIWTHLEPASKGRTGLGVYADGMVEHDGQVGQLLDKLKELGIEQIRLEDQLLNTAEENLANLEQLLEERRKRVEERAAAGNRVETGRGGLAPEPMMRLHVVTAGRCLRKGQALPM